MTDTPSRVPSRHSHLITMKKVNTRELNRTQTMRDLRTRMSHRFLAAMTTPWQRQHGWGRSGQITVPHHSPSLWEVRAGPQQGRNLEEGADAEAMEGCCSRACSPCLAQPVLLYSPRTTCPSMALHTVDWALSHPLSIKKMPTVLPTRHSNEGTPQLKFPSLR